MRWDTTWRLRLQRVTCGRRSRFRLVISRHALHLPNVCAAADSLVRSKSAQPLHQETPRPESSRRTKWEPRLPVFRAVEVAGDEGCRVRDDREQRWPDPATSRFGRATLPPSIPSPTRSPCFGQQWSEIRSIINYSSSREDPSRRRPAARGPNMTDNSGGFKV